MDAWNRLKIALIVFAQKIFPVFRRPWHHQVIPMLLASIMVCALACLCAATSFVIQQLIATDIELFAIGTQANRSPLLSEIRARNCLFCLSAGYPYRFRSDSEQLSENQETSELHGMQFPRQTTVPACLTLPLLLLELFLLLRSLGQLRKSKLEPEICCFAASLASAFSSPRGPSKNKNGLFHSSFLGRNESQSLHCEYVAMDQKRLQNAHHDVPRVRAG